MSESSAGNKQLELPMDAGYVDYTSPPPRTKTAHELELEEVVASLKETELKYGIQVGGTHYGKNDPVKFSQDNKLTFLEGNAVKYVTRHRHKNGEEDIDKAIHCLHLIKRYVYGQKKAPS